MVSQYLHKNGLTTKAIHNDMVATLVKNAPSYATIKSWVKEFKHCRESLQDNPRSGRPVTLATLKIATKIHDMLIGDRRVTVRYLASTVKISHERVIPFLWKIWL